MIKPTLTSWLDARTREAMGTYTLLVRRRGRRVFAHYFNPYGNFRCWSRMWTGAAPTPIGWAGFIRAMVASLGHTIPVHWTDAQVIAFYDTLKGEDR